MMVTTDSCACSPAIQANHGQMTPAFLLLYALIIQELRIRHLDIKSSLPSGSPLLKNRRDKRISTMIFGQSLTAHSKPTRAQSRTQPRRHEWFQQKKSRSFSLSNFQLPIVKESHFNSPWRATLHFPAKAFTILSLATRKSQQTTLFLTVNTRQTN